MAARSEDVGMEAVRAEQSQLKAWQSFERVCGEMDEDGSGDISLEEFKETWSNSEEFQQHLLIMGIREQDMAGLLKVMDIDGSGHLDREEFIEQFTRMRTGVVNTTLYYILRNVQDIERHVIDEAKALRVMLAELHNIESKQDQGKEDFKQLHRLKEPAKFTLDTQGIRIYEKEQGADSWTKLARPVDAQDGAGTTKAIPGTCYSQAESKESAFSTDSQVVPRILKSDTGLTKNETRTAEAMTEKVIYAQNNGPLRAESSRKQKVICADSSGPEQHDQATWAYATV